MGVSHAFVSAAPPVADPTKVGSNEWNAPHVINIVNADVDPAAAIDESKLNLNFPTHAALTLGVVSSGLSIAGQVLSLGLASSGVTGALSGADWDTFNNKQSALTFPLSPALGGTGVDNGTNALTVPATGTAALLAVNNAFTGNNTFTRGTAANNLFLGGAGNTTTTGDNNVCFGSSAGGALTGGNGNLLLGKNSGTSLTSGENNTFIGYNSGTNITTTSNNIIIGADQRGQAGDVAKLYIHPGNVTVPMIYGDFAQSYFQLNSRGTSTNTIRSILQLRAVVTTGSTGGAAGLGVASDYYAETATDGTYQLQGRVSTAWVDATNATRKATLSLSAYDTAQRTGLIIEANGTTPDVRLLGDTWWEGEGFGLPYGSFYGNEINFSTTVNNSYAIIADTDCAEGQTNLMTYTDAGTTLTTVKAGRYLCTWYVSAESSTANIHILAGLMVDSTTTLQAAGQNHLETTIANWQLAMSGSAILDLAAGAVVGVGIGSDANITITVDHVGLTMTQIGGT